MLLKHKLAEVKNKTMHDLILKKRDQHLEEQNEERRKYYHHSRKAKRAPNRYLSIIIDGMDQAKTSVPHFVELSSTVGSIWKLKVHVTGVIVHGIGHFGFFDIHQWPHGSAMTITVIQNVLKMVKEVPKVLYLQMDNCGRENKNRFLLGYLCHLVEQKIFEKIKLSFLMVGHTHEDVDQMFSRFSCALKKKACLTLPKMMKCFENSFTPKPTAVLLNQVYNTNDWLAPCLDKITGHSGPHAFKIILNANGKAFVLWKNWTTDKEWKQTEGPLLKVAPVDEPSPLPPRYSEEEMDYLQDGVRKAFKFFRRDDDNQWWEEVFKNRCVEDKSISAPFGLQDVQIGQTEKTDEVDEELANIKTKSTPMAPVIIGRKQISLVEQREHKSTTEELKIGDLCLLDVPKYAGEWPQVAQITELCAGTDQVLIQWFKGSVTGSWTPCSVAASGARGKRVAWTESVQRHNIWHFGFSLTPAKTLPRSVRKKIDEYADF